MKEKVINLSKIYLINQITRLFHKTVKKIFMITFITIHIHQINIKKFMRIFLEFRYPSSCKKIILIVLK